MFAELLAVIAEHDHDRVGKPSARLERLEQAAHLAVGVGDLGVVGANMARRKLRGELGGGVVRRVRIVEVHPAEERARVGLAQPGERACHHLVAAALDGIEPGPDVGGEVEVVKIVREALRNAPAAVEYEGADEAAGAITLRGKDLGHRREAVVDMEAGVVAHAVIGRERACEERGVGGKGQRRRRRRVGEAGAPRGEAVDDGRLRRAVAIGAHVIRAQRVERDDEHVGRAGRLAAAGRRQREENEERRAREGAVARAREEHA